MSKGKKNLKKVLSSVLAFAMVFGMGFSSVVSVNVEAASDTNTDDEKHTVTLVDSENGKIEFQEESDGRFAEGETVNLKLEADDGYIPSGITINDADSGEEIVSKSTNDDLYSFTMPSADLRIKGSFMSDPDTLYTETIEVDSDEVISDALLEDYIADNLNPEYIASVDKVAVVNYLKVMNTLFNGEYVEEGDTIDSIMLSVSASDASGYDKFLASFDAEVALYDLNEDSDYYVGFANTMYEDKGVHVFDYEFAMNDNSGTLIDGCIYDVDTGLAYIPKSMFINDDGEYIIASVQIQLGQLVTISYTEIESEVTTEVSDDDEVDVYEKDTNIFNLETITYTEPGLTKDDFTVYVNGLPIEDSVYEYDSETGAIMFGVSSAVIGYVTVELNEDVELDEDYGIDTLRHQDPTTGLYMPDSWSDMYSINDEDSPIQLPSWVTVGTALYDENARIGYFGNSSGATGAGDNDKTAYGLLYSGMSQSGSNNYLTEWIWGEASGQTSVELSDTAYAKMYEPVDAMKYFRLDFSNTDFAYQTQYRKTSDSSLQTIKLQTWNKDATSTEPIGKTVDLKSLGIIWMRCTHIGTSDSDWGSGYQDVPCLARFLYISEDENGVPFAALGLVTSEINNQTGFGIIKIITTPSTGYLTLNKASGNTVITAGNSNYSLTGAEYTVYTDSSCTTVAKDADNKNAVLTTTSDGSTNTLELEAGTYYVKETKASTGYKIDTTVYTLTVESGETTTENVKETPETSYVTLVKSSDSTTITDDNSCYDLTGAKYTLYTDASCSTVAKDASGSNAVLTTKSDGTTDVLEMPLGTYYVQETSRPDGYELTTRTATVTLTTSYTKDSPAKVTFSDPPINDPFYMTILKIDAESGKSEPQGDADLAGAEFTVNFYAGYYDEDALPSTPTRTWVFDTVLNGDAYEAGPEVTGSLVESRSDSYYTYKGEDVFPLGTYTIIETGQPVGYLLEGTFTDADGEVVDAGTAYYNQLQDDGSKNGYPVWLKASNYDLYYTAADDVIRGDFHFVKQDGENQTTDLGSIPFQITSKTTGESHIIWTDENGEYNSSSAWNKHTYNTDAGNDKYDGLWFYGYSDWEDYAGTENDYVDDSLGALPFDDYYLDELPCDANEGRTLIHTSFTISRNGWDVNLGTIDNYEYGFATYASNEAGSSKYLDASENTVLLDTIQYWGLEAGEEYKFTTKLYDVTTGGFVAGSDGKDGSWSLTFEPSASAGTKNVTITFDATGLEGHTIVVYEYMYGPDGDLLVSEETPTDEDQTVYFPKIGTELTDEDGNHKIDADEKVTLIDTVEYENLPVNTYVTMHGILYDKDTGEPLLDATGREVTAEKTWYNTTESGTIDIEFVFNASLLAGDSVVASEEARVDGIAVGHHFDWDDVPQTVEFNPAIHTLATDDNTGLQYIDINGNVTINDAVEYKGLEPGEQYTFRTEIFDLTADKTVTTSTSTVTPESRYGVANVQITFDATGMEGHTLVVFETVTDSTGEEIVTEENPDAEEQMIYFPEIGTELTDTEDNHTVSADGIVTLIDTVEYSNLPVDKEITMTGVLYDSATGEPVVDANGHTVTAEKTWYNKTESGTVEIEFEFDASLLAGRSVVASEEAVVEGITVGHHFDWTDEPQTVEFPTEIDTTATNAETGLHYIDPSEFITIEDAIEFKGLDPDETYTFVTELYDVTTGDFVKSHLTEEPVVEEYEDIEDIESEDNEAKDEAYDVSPLAASILTKGVFTGDTFTLSASADGEYEILYDEGLELVDEDGFRYTFTVAEPGEYDVAFEYENGDVNGYRIVARDVSEEDADYTINTIVGEEFIVDITGASLVTISSALDEMAAPEESGDAFTANEAGTYFIALDYYDGTSVVYAVYAEDAPVEDDYLVIVTEFSSEDWYGEEDVEFTFDASGLAGHTVVIYETVYDSEGNIVALETDPEEAGQMLFFTDIGTTLTDQNDDHETMYGDDVVLIDTVEYENLPVDTWITMTGTLYDKETGEPIVDKHGDEITTEYVWYNLVPSGTVEIEFVFDASLLGGHTLVAAEYADFDGITIGHHFDYNDEGQTEYFPKIGTELTNDWTGEHQSTIFENHDISLTDTVGYENLIPGEEYTMVGVLIDKETEEIVTDREGNQITQVVTFTPEEADGVVEMTFTFDAYGMHDTYLVAFEYLYDAMGNVIASHEDIEDEGQTVQLLVPTVWTYAAETSTGRKSIEPDEHVSITDYLDVSDLIVGHTYYIYGRAVDKETGELINDHYGEPLELYIEFTADAEEMYLEFMQFEFDAEDLGGKEIVFEEYVYADADRTILICEEEDLGSAEQTVFILGPIELGTTLTENTTNDHIAYADDKVLLTDEVEYTGAKVGETYVVTGTLMDKETGLALTDADGNEIVAESEPFVAEEEHGFVEVTFEMDASDMAGKSVVAYEFMYNSEGTLVSAHEDINDEDQTVDFPKIGTTLVDSETGFHGAATTDHVTLIDTVEYENLIPGKTYVVEGTLMNQATEKPIRDANNEYVTATSEPFVPEEADGIVEVTFEFDASNVDEKMYTVAYEYLYVEAEAVDDSKETPDEYLVASHEDIDDSAQTVELDEIYIGTTLLDEASGTHEADADGRVTLVDTVEYDGLIVGETYTLEGTLMDKATGVALKDSNGNAVVGESTFTANEKSGVAVVTFTFDATGMNGTFAVAFEQLYDAEARLVASHEDINDEAQTVKLVHEDEEKTPTETTVINNTNTSGSGPKTGDYTNIVLWIVLGVLAVAGCGTGIVVYRRRNRK